MATDQLARYSDEVWDAAIVPTLEDYIRIPNVSPAFDPAWAEAGHMDLAVELARQWCASRPVEGLTVEVVQLPDRTPLLLLEVPGTGDSTALLYGHLDKQPPMTEGWRGGLDPWEPVIDEGRLYGRGGADDGYATFASVTAIEAVQAAGLEHARCLVLIECSEWLAISLPWSQVIDPSQLIGQRRDGFAHGGIDAGGGPVVLKVQQQHEPGAPLDEGAYGAAAARSDDEVALPVAGHGSVLNLGGPLCDVDHPGQPSSSLDGAPLLADCAP